MFQFSSTLFKSAVKLAALTILLGSLIPFSPSHAARCKVLVKVDVSQQRMTVYQNGRKKYHWKVSTARKGKVTPRGNWKAKWLSKNHRSSRYNNAPMPYSIFYSGNFAIHGTNSIGRLGRPASAGCIRLHPKNAAILFRLAQSYGLSNMTVSVRN